MEAKDFRRITPSEEATRALDRAKSLNDGRSKLLSSVEIADNISSHGGWAIKETPTTTERERPDNNRGFSELKSVNPVRMINSYRGISLAANYDTALLALTSNLAGSAPADPNETPDVEHPARPGISLADALSFDALQNYRLLEEKYLHDNPGAIDTFNNRTPNLPAALAGEDIRLSPAEQVAADYLSRLGLMEQFMQLPPDGQNELMQLFREASFKPEDGEKIANLVTTDNVNLEAQRETFAALHETAINRTGLSKPFSNEAPAEAKDNIKNRADYLYDRMFLRLLHKNSFGLRDEYESIIAERVDEAVLSALDSYRRENPDILPSVLQRWGDELAEQLHHDIVAESFAEHAKSAKNYDRFDKWLNANVEYREFLKKANTDPHWLEISIEKRAKQRVDNWWNLAKARVKLGAAATVGLKGNVRRQRELREIRDELNANATNE